MLVKEKNHTDYTEDWPIHYYEIEDIAARERILRERIEQYDEAGDRRRMELLKKRFSGKKKDDLFFHAWMMFIASQNEKPNFLNRRRKEKEFHEWAGELCIEGCARDEILEEEWKDFAEKYLRICASSGSYRAVLGIIPMKDVHLAYKIRNEIILVTRKLPALYGCEEQFADLYRIMRTEYIRLIENGAEYWDE